MDEKKGNVLLRIVRLAVNDPLAVTFEERHQDGFPLKYDGLGYRVVDARLRDKRMIEFFLERADLFGLNRSHPV